MKKLVCFIFATLLLAACNSDNHQSDGIKIGTISGPETELMEVAVEIAKERYDLTVKIVEFDEYIIPNTALADGSIDANAFQHQPYLDNFIKISSAHLVPLGKTFIYPMGIYSNNYDALSQIPYGAKVAIPNDPSNEARALLLLEAAGFIELEDTAGVHATQRNIASNPHNLHIIEINSAQLPRALPDVDMAIINTNYAIPANLLPTRDALFIEDGNSPYANLIVVRSEDINNADLQHLLQAFQSPEVIDRANSLFEGQALPAWID